jgi:hypothetical protein
MSILPHSNPLLVYYLLYINLYINIFKYKAISKYLWGSALNQSESIYQKLPEAIMVRVST